MKKHTQFQPFDRWQQRKPQGMPSNSMLRAIDARHWTRPVSIADQIRGANTQAALKKAIKLAEQAAEEKASPKTVRWHNSLIVAATARIGAKKSPKSSPVPA